MKTTLTRSRTLSDVDPKCFRTTSSPLDLSPVSAEKTALWHSGTDQILN